MSVALVTGVTGQDGSYLVDRLLEDGVEVHGMVRAGDPSTGQLRSAHPQVHLHETDLADGPGLHRLVREVAPDQLFNLAGISSVATSWEQPGLTGLLSGLAVAELLAAALDVQESTGRPVAVVQASSAEIFGEPDRVPQDEATAVRPTNPYGAAKAYAHHMSGIYRSRGLAVSSCILFNHESPRRPPAFVTRKITQAAARIGREGTGEIALGNLDARRDWGWAPDYVDALVRAANHPGGGDFVVATGETHSVAEFAAAALARVGIVDWERWVRTDPAFVRPTDTAQLVGDPTRAREVLGWTPTRSFSEVVHAMVDHDVQLLG